MTQEQNKYTFTIGEKELALIIKALDLYSRIGILQLHTILEHPSIDKMIQEAAVTPIDKHDEDDGCIPNKINWQDYHALKDKINQYFSDVKYLIAGIYLGTNGSHGIHSKKIDESCREAFDILQVFRHEIWKNQPDRNNAVVSSSVHYASDHPIDITIKAN